MVHHEGEASRARGSALPLQRRRDAGAIAGEKLKGIGDAVLAKELLTQASAMADTVPIPTQAGKSMVSLQAQVTVLLKP